MCGAAGGEYQPFAGSVDGGPVVERGIPKPPCCDVLAGAAARFGYGALPVAGNERG